MNRIGYLIALLGLSTQTAFAGQILQSLRSTQAALPPTSVIEWLEYTTYQNRSDCAPSYIHELTREICGALRSFSKDSSLDKIYPRLKPIFDRRNNVSYIEITFSNIETNMSSLKEIPVPHQITDNVLPIILLTKAINNIFDNNFKTGSSELRSALSLNKIPLKPILATNFRGSLKDILPYTPPSWDEVD